MKKSKSLPKLKADCQKIFNEFIRLRDQGKPCISCGLIKPLQAGHYFPTQGYDGLRFNEDNVHGECSGCNCFDDSHLIHYGDNLKERLGINGFMDLKMKANIYKSSGYKWSRSELIELIEKYKAKVKELRNQKTIC